METSSETTSRVCRKCHRELPLTEFQTVNKARGWARHECKDCTRNRIKTWWNTKPESAPAVHYRWQKAYAKRRDWILSPEGRRHINANVRERTKYLQQIVYEVYGGKCACCGEANWGFLTIDHVNNDGKLDRDKGKKRGRSGADMYRWILKNDFPATFQLLCYNCNIGKHRNRGVCPHLQSERSTTIPQGSTSEAIAEGSAPPFTPLG